MNWTAHESRVLRKLLAQNVDMQTIALAMNRSEESIKAKIRWDRQPQKTCNENIVAKRERQSKLEEIQKQRAVRKVDLNMKDFTAGFLGDPSYERSALYQHHLEQQNRPDGELIPDLSVKSEVQVMRYGKQYARSLG